jgi:AraC-like DNA-binding protein
MVLQLAAAVAAVGGSSQQLLSELEVSVDTLAEPERRVGLKDFVPLVERAAKRSSLLELVFSLGMSASATRFGLLGFAAMSCATLGEAIDVSVRYSPLISSVIRLRARRTGERASVEVEEVNALGAAAPLLIPSLLIALWRLGESLTGRPLPGDADFTFSEPDGFAAYRAFAPGVVRFDQPCNRLVFDAAYLELPIVSADLSAARATREQCERMLRELGNSAQLATRVTCLLFGADGSIASPRQIARQLGMSERTLKRRLAEQDTSYTDLLDHERHVRALELLRGDTSVEEVSSRLGYSDAANFTRAFRRWTGKSPRALRQNER